VAALDAVFQDLDLGVGGSSDLKIATATMRTCNRRRCNIPVSSSDNISGHSYSPRSKKNGTSTTGAAIGLTEREVWVGKSRERRMITAIFSAEPERWYRCSQDLRAMISQSVTCISGSECTCFFTRPYTICITRGGGSGNDTNGPRQRPRIRIGS